MQVTVSKEWMRACGHPAVNTIFDVISIMPRRMPDGSRMFIVQRRDGPWTVSEWRIVDTYVDGGSKHPAGVIL